MKKLFFTAIALVAFSGVSMASTIFLEVIEYNIANIQNNPTHFQVRRVPYREAIVRKFPFVIIYEIKDSKVIIYAVFNTFLNPEKKP